MTEKHAAQIITEHEKLIAHLADSKDRNSAIEKLLKSLKSTNTAEFEKLRSELLSKTQRIISLEINTEAATR
jgi:hypothetical protein